MNNAWKWLLTIAVGFLGGALSALTDPGIPSVMDIVRHGAIGVLPAIGALQMSLKKELGQ